MAAQQANPVLDAMLRAVPVVFGEWTCLKLAVENEWGGPATREKALGLLQRIMDGLAGSAEVHRDEVESLLEAALIDDFSIEAEDESCKEVAQILFMLHYEARQGQTTTAEALIQRATARGTASWVDVAPPRAARKDDSSDEDISDDEEGDGSAPMDMEGGGGSSRRAPPEVDEDGFQTVARRR
jgi:pre-rRNA-processing protein TSR2